MKKFIVAAAGILLVLLSCISSFAAERRVVRVGAFNNFPAIFKDKDGVVKGFFVDALADIAARENIRFEYVYGYWSEGLERIKSGEVDVLTSVAHTPERDKFLDYARTPLLTVWGELYAPPSSRIYGIREVQGKKVAVMKGDINARHFIELVNKLGITCEIVEVPGYDDVFRAVAAKKVDAGVVNSTFGVARQNYYGLRSTGVVFDPYDTFFAVAKGEDKNLLALLDGYLSKWRHQADSPYNEARRKWSHVSTDTLHVIPPLLAYSAAALGLLIIAAAIFIVLLRRQVRRATKTLQTVLTRQKALLAAIPDIIMEVNTRKVYTWANEAGMEFFGEDVIGKEASYYFAGEQDTYEKIRPLLSGAQNVIYIESWQKRRDGEIRLLAWWCKLLEDERGEITGVLSSARDITENRRTQDALQKQVVALTQPLDDPAGIKFTDLFNIEEIQRIQDTFAEATGVASIITAPDGIPITRPSNFCRLCNEIIRKTEKGLANCLRSDASLGRFNQDGPVIQPCLSGGLWDAGASISVGGRHVANWLIGQVRNEEQDDSQMLAYADEIDADREEFMAALAEVPVMPKERFEKVAMALSSLACELSLKAYQNVQQARFIAERKQFEKELLDKNAELERYTYTVSHDLKSPVITIKAFAGSMEKDLSKGDYGRMAGDLKRVSDAADKMNDLLRDLLELSTIGHVINTPEPVDMNLLVDHVLAQLAGPLMLHNLSIAVQPDLPEVFCDRRRMAEVIQNLVENAVNYMGGQAEPRIQFGMRDEQGKQVFFVQDNGIGIDERYHRTIFGLFNKLDAKSRGTGIGLALVKRIIEVHGGQVWVESKGVGFGSRFCFTVAQKQ